MKISTIMKVFGLFGLIFALTVAVAGTSDQVVSGIAASAEEQIAGLREVNTAVNEVTQQNAAMVEQANAASRSLAQEGQDLVELAARFNVGALEDRSPSVAAARSSRLSRAA